MVVVCDCSLCVFVLLLRIGLLVFCAVVYMCLCVFVSCAFFVSFCARVSIACLFFCCIISTLS